MPTISPPTITLTEDQIDDLLYYSRTNDIEELVSTLCTIKSALGEGVSEGDILLNAVDAESGNGVLHMAAANGHGDVLNSLLEFLPSSPSTTTTGTPPTQTPHPALTHQNTSGNTPLHWASLNGHLSCVKLLVEKGQADPTAVNNAGHDAVYEAEVAERGEVVEWLLRNCEGLERGVGGASGEGGEEAEDVGVNVGGWEEGSGGGKEKGNGKGKEEGKEKEGEGINGKMEELRFE